jgi:hypothetical protein
MSRLQREFSSKDRQIARLEHEVKDRTAELRIPQQKNLNLQQYHEKTLEAKNGEPTEIQEEKARWIKVSSTALMG